MSGAFPPDAGCSHSTHPWLPFPVYASRAAIHTPPQLSTAASAQAPGSRMCSHPPSSPPVLTDVPTALLPCSPLPALHVRWEMTQEPPTRSSALLASWGLRCKMPRRGWG